MKPRSGAGSRSVGWRFNQALNECRPIVFIDEGGLSQGPLSCRTRVLRGQTPVLQYYFTRRTLSAMVGVPFGIFTSGRFPTGSEVRRESNS
jgi:hypothetical protein